MRIIVLISTIDDRIKAVPKVLLPEEEGVSYVVVWQKNKVDSLELRVDSIKRGDVRVIEMEGKGLSKSRNCAVDAALESLGDTLEDAVLVIADDDEWFMPGAFQRIRAAYERHPKLDGALFRLRSSKDGRYFKDYPKKEVLLGKHPRTYYPCSLEMTVRSRVFVSGLRFDERFGLGSEQLGAGEEDVLLTDMQRKGMKVMIVPEDIATTEPYTTGSRQIDPLVLRSKGALYGYRMALVPAIVRGAKEALSLAVRHRKRVWPLWKEIWFGINYIRS